MQGWYKTGTVTVTNGSATVTGSGTAWVANVSTGVGFVGPDNKIYEVQAVNSDTQLTLSGSYGGATASGQSYTIFPTQSYEGKLASDTATLITQYSTAVNLWTSGAFSSGTTSAPGINFNGTANGFYYPTTNAIGVVTNGSERLRIDGSGVVTQTSNNAEFRLTESGTYFGSIKVDSSGGLTIGADPSNVATNSRLTFAVDGSERMRIDASGNVGLGGSPSNWSSSFKAIQLGQYGAVYSSTGGTFLSDNTFVDATNGLTYIGAKKAAQYSQQNGDHFWSSAPTGTANAALTFTNTMTLTSAGVLSVPGGITAALTGNASTATKLQTARTISLTGDVTYTSGSFDGSANVTGTATLANTGVTASTYNNSATAITPLTIDAKGRITATGTAVTITPAWASVTGKPTTVSGYGITDAVLKGGDTMTGALTLSGDPTANLHAATKQYVDAVASGLDLKASVKVATTAAITLSGTQTIDGVAVVAGDRVLVKNQADATTNGIYVVAAGAWARSTDADSNAEVTPGMFTFVEQGTTNADSGWVLTTDGPITLTSSSLNFSQFSGAGQITAGTGLSKSGNTLSLATSGVTAGTYNNSATSVMPLTVDATGRITATGTAVTITPAFSSITGKPTTLSGYGITDAQPLDAELTAFAGLSTNGLVVKTAAGAATTRTLAVSGTGLSVTNADGIAGNPTITSNATNANTASTIVARDASGNFSAGTITAALTGNASTATTLQTARNIALTGDATGTASFNGSANASITASIPGIGNYRTSVLITANTTLTTSDFGKFYQIATNSGITVTLPSASGQNGKTFLFWANNVSATLSITASGGFFYGPYSTAGTSTFALSSGSVLKIVSDGFNWIVTSLAPSTGGTLGVINGGTGTSTQFTQGSVVFAGASGVYSQNNANFFWDNTNARLGIGTTSPDKALTVVGTEQVIKAVGSGNIGISVSSTGGGVPYFNINGNRDWQLRQETTGELAIRDNTAIAERFRIDSGGRVGIGTSSPTSNPNPGVAILPDGRLHIGHPAGYDNYGFIIFYNTGTQIGSVAQSPGGAGVAFNTTSDVRLKTNINDAGDSGSVIDAIRVVEYDWKLSGKHVDFGVIAQELHEVFPDAVTPGDEDSPWGWDSSFLVPLLVKELQALRKRIMALETAASIQ